jgi:hypothetical protein
MSSKDFPILDMFLFIISALLLAKNTTNFGSDGKIQAAKSLPKSMKKQCFAQYTKYTYLNIE